MRIVRINEGRLEIRWTWLPYWLASAPSLVRETETSMKDAIVMNGVTPDDLDGLHDYVISRISARFPGFNLKPVLEALSHVPE